jgi:hypothetical protein
MNLAMNAPLPGTGISPVQGLGVAKQPSDYPQKFEDIAPGSTVMISGEGVAEPFRATVMNTIPELPPTGIPAILVTATWGDDFVITASGKYQVQVVADGRELAASMPKPESAVTVRTRPRNGEAIQFRGGRDSAVEIVRWAVGSATFRYIAETDQEADHLQMVAVNGPAVWAGDWIVKLDDGSFRVLDDKAFPAEFEERS